MTHSKKGIWLLLFVSVILSVVCSSVHAEISVSQPLYADFISRYVYTFSELDTSLRSMNLVYDDTAFTNLKLRATRPLGRTELTIYKLSNEPLSQYVLPRRVYQYITLESKNLDASLIQHAEVEMHIPTSWLESNGLKAGQLVLFHFDEESKEWKEKETIVLPPQDGHQPYKAIITDGIGNFAIGILEPFEFENRMLSAQALRAAEPRQPQQVQDSQPDQQVPGSAPGHPTQEEQPATREEDAPANSPSPQYEMPEAVRSAPPSLPPWIMDAVMGIIIGSVALLALLLLIRAMQLRKSHRHDPLKDEFSRIQHSVENLKKDVHDKHHLSYAVMDAENVLSAIEEKMDARRSIPKKYTKTLHTLQHQVEELSPRIIRRFFSYQRKKGYRDEQIYEMLHQNGFDDTSIRNALL